MFTELYTKQLAGYASYHTDARNEATHFIGIPLIVIGVLFVASWPKLLGLPLSVYIFIAFAVLWMSMDLLIGGIVVEAASRLEVVLPAITADGHLHDLGRAFVDRGDADIALDLLNHVFACVAVTAVGLDRRFCS